MTGALIEATLPVVMRRTCVCPSRLFSAAMKCLAIQVRWVEVEVRWISSFYFSFIFHG